MNLLFSGSGLVGSKIIEFDYIFKLVECKLPETILMCWIRSRFLTDVPMSNSVRQQSSFLTNIFKGNSQRAGVANQFISLLLIVVLIVKF